MSNPIGPYTLPPLPYPVDALEPHIDRQTMEIHHQRHHQTYVTQLNLALSGKQVPAMPVDDLVARLDTLPVEIRQAVRNHGGGHANHSLFWTVMSPDGGGTPQGALATAIDRDFGDLATFRDAFNQAATSRFGSGWAWLTVDGLGRLHVESTANQDHPRMPGIGSGNTPILGLDVWEHAYYLRYQNRRVDYIGAFHQVIDWSVVAQRFERAMA